MDDGSTDDTRDIVDRYGKHVRYTYQLNQGLSSARNATIAQSSGELIAYLDADDKWIPIKLAKQVAFLDTHPECGMVHGEVTVINGDDQVIRARFNQETGRTIPQGHCLMDLLRTNHIQVPTVLERRACVASAGLFDERLSVAQDCYHWIMLSIQGWAIGYLYEPLAHYRWRRGSLMTTPRALLQDYVCIFGHLLREPWLAHLIGREGRKIIRSRHVVALQELTYLDRMDGRVREGLSHVALLLKESPFTSRGYLELLKTCLSTVGADFR